MKSISRNSIGRLLATALIIGSVCMTSSCRKYRGLISGYSTRYRQELESAKNAEEWFKRLELDIENFSTHNEILTNLYAELPPQDQWQEISRRTAEIASDLVTLGQTIKTTYTEDAEIMNLSKKLLIFSALLVGGDAESHLRELIDVTEVKSYEAKSVVRSLLAMSKDRDATLSWIQKNHPKLIEENEHNHSKEAKKPWQIALAENKIEEGIKMLIALIENGGDISNDAEDLMKIGLVLNREDIVTLAVKALEDSLAKEIKNDGYFSSYSYRDLFTPALKIAGWKHIEEVYLKTREGVKAMKIRSSSDEFLYQSDFFAAYLVAVYKLGKMPEFSDGILAAQKSVGNEPSDFFKMLNFQKGDIEPLGVLYLDYLKSAGKTEMVWDYACHLVVNQPGTDAFYESLISSDKERARAFMQSLSLYDPYEERPLIWLAEIARRDGDLKLAREIIDKAIALDPSDGDHGKNSRMFCYEILARILKDEGDDEKSKFFRAVVGSIRQGEAADDYLEAGLIQEATNRYKQALGQFENAYCLQSRLAMTLARNGCFEEAIPHFKKAFELMPLSFGPRESHCFGCEGLFNDPRVADIALPLLEAYWNEHPENPRTPYLLGLVLSEKNDKLQARLAFEKALEIDPNYFNAAKKLLDLLENDPKSYAAADSLRQRMFEFAPYAEKVTVMPKEAQLAEHWQLVSNVPASPLRLPGIPFLANQEKQPEKAQYVERKDFRSRYISDRARSIDSWSASELRRHNSILKKVEDIN